jgi:hypothetical protein
MTSRRRNRAAFALAALAGCAAVAQPALAARLTTPVYDTHGDDAAHCRLGYFG